MNQDDIIRMAREAGFLESGAAGLIGFEEFLERFAALIAAHEREACAYRAGFALLGADRELANRVDKAIRARGNVREHTMSGDCWCNPDLNYTDPETGTEVWVHKEPQ